METNVFVTLQSSKGEYFKTDRPQKGIAVRVLLCSDRVIYYPLSIMTT